MHVASIVQKPVPKSFLFVLDVLVNLVDVINKAVYLAEAPFDEIEFVIKLPNFIAQLVPVVFNILELFLLAEHLVSECLPFEIFVQKLVVLILTHVEHVQVVSFALFVQK